jgi:hypothetical protein
LDVAPKNYPFLLFATGKKHREFLRALVQESDSPYLPLAFALYPRDVMEELQMSRKSTKYEEDLRYAVDHLLAHVSPEILAEALESQPLTRQTQVIDALLERLDLDALEARLQARRAQAQG